MTSPELVEFNTGEGLEKVLIFLAPFIFRSKC